MAVLDDRAVPVQVSNDVEDVLPSVRVLDDLAHGHARVRFDVVQDGGRHLALADVVELVALKTSAMGADVRDGRHGAIRRPGALVVDRREDGRRLVGALRHARERLADFLKALVFLHQRTQLFELPVDLLYRLRERRLLPGCHAGDLLWMVESCSALIQRADDGTTGSSGIWCQILANPGDLCRSSIREMVRIEKESHQDLSSWRRSVLSKRSGCSVDGIRKPLFPGD